MLVGEVVFVDECAELEREGEEVVVSCDRGRGWSVLWCEIGCLGSLEQGHDLLCKGVHFEGEWYGKTWDETGWGFSYISGGFKVSNVRYRVGTKGVLTRVSRYQRVLFVNTTFLVYHDTVLLDLLG